MAALEFRLPDVGEGIATAEIVAWQVAEGDRVTEHQDLVEIQTDKATVVIPSPADGVVTRLCGDAGRHARRRRGAGGDRGRGRAPLRRRRRRAHGARESVTSASADAPAARGPSARRADHPAPRARARGGARGGGWQRPARAHRARGRRARRGRRSAPPPALGAGDSAALRRAPARRRALALRRLPTAAAPGEVVPLRGVRRTIAHALTRAWLEVPRIIDYREVDATALVRARASLSQRALDRGDDALAKALTPTPFAVRAAVLAARDHPYVNASIDLEAEEITLHGHYHVGIAAAGPDGLTVPVVHDADRRSLAELAHEIVALSQAARERRLRPDQLAGPTITVNNFGSLGTWMGTPIVRPPEVVNLGVGAIRDRVVAVDGAPVVRPTMVLSVAGDHRVLDGDGLSAFVDQVQKLLEDPVLLFEDLR